MPRRPRSRARATRRGCHPSPGDAEHAAGDLPTREEDVADGPDSVLASEPEHRVQRVDDEGQGDESAEPEDERPQAWVAVPDEGATAGA